MIFNKSKLYVLVVEISKHPKIKIFKKEPLKIKVVEIKEPTINTYSLQNEDSSTHEVLLVGKETFTLRGGNNLRVRKDGI